MNVIDAMGRILRASSSGYVGLWEVRIKIFYEQVDGEEIVDCAERKRTFKQSKEQRTRELTYVRDILSTLFDQQWVTLLECVEPDGEMTEVEYDRVKAPMRVDDVLISEPKAGATGYYLNITPKGEEVLQKDILSLR